MGDNNIHSHMICCCLIFAFYCYDPLIGCVILLSYSRVFVTFIMKAIYMINHTSKGWLCMGGIHVKVAAFLMGIMVLSLAGCQHNNLFGGHTITSIQVQEWESDKVITTIKDEDIIRNLTSALTSADTHSTAAMSFPKPDYRLLFISNEQVVKTLGYYIEEKDLGVSGRYQDIQRDIHYQVTIKLPIDDMT